MLIHNLKTFCSRREIYYQELNDYCELEDISQDKKDEILEVLCDILMNPEYAKDVSECFPQLLLILLAMCINKDEEIYNTIEADLVHTLNCTVIGKLILIHPDVLGFALQYFEVNPSPFESPSKDSEEPSKAKRRKQHQFPHQVSDYEIVEACYNILLALPDHFKYKWNWSKFYKYLMHEDDRVKWLAIKCIGIILEMSESIQFSCATALIDNIDEFATEIQESTTHLTLQATNSSAEVKEFVKNVPSIAYVAGVLLPVFNKQTQNIKSDLVSVKSMDENLRSLALAVASRKCVCVQGPVGCGKTAIIEYLAKITGHGSEDFIKVQLGDQTDSKMLLGTYRCTDIPGEFIWQPGVLTEAVVSGKWLLLEDIDSAALDVASVLSGLLETGTLTVPGYRDTVHVKSGFQLFVTQRLIPSVSGFQKQSSGTTSLLEKHWLCINTEPLSKDELVIVVQTLFPVLNTVATRMVDVFLLFSVGNHDTNEDESESTILKTGRLISTRDLIKWCSRAIVDFVVSSPESAIKLFQDAIDIFCCSVPNQDQRLTLAKAIGDKLGIIRTKAEYFIKTHKPSITLSTEYFVGGRTKLIRKKSSIIVIEKDEPTFSFTRPSACLLERIATCVAQNEPVLLVGETGTGKTSSIQYLARSTGHKLIVINMNQQSESADLLGGYKPVDLKYLIFPIREEFEILFRSYFAVEPNKKFLSHIGICYERRKWKILVSLMAKSTAAALNRLRVKVKNMNGQTTEDNKDVETLRKWESVAAKLEKLETQVKSELSLAFSFIEGSLIKALKEGYWVLLDEINLANAETLECLSGLLEGSSGSLSLLERGDKNSIKRHPDFTIFACMNPATDVGKKELPVGLRNRFTEFYIDELTERNDLQLLVSSYLEELNVPVGKQESIVKFYLNVRQEATWTLFDGTSHKPHYSLRTLCRALSIAASNPCGIVFRSLYEAFCLSFLTQLDYKSYPVVQKMISDAVLDKTTAKSVLSSPIPKPGLYSNEDYLQFEGYWIVKGNVEPKIPSNYVLTESVKRNLRDIARAVSIGKMPVLLQGDTSVGKTSLITYLAKASGNICLRINNHEHTDLQEYIGNYVADDSGRLIFREGILVEAMRKGYWIILDELNLAPSDVLEALNRVLDDNRELFIPETQQTIKAHENFMLFATQNPPGLYGGRKVLSRAFRNRFVELHFDEIPPVELAIILHERCSMPMSYCKQIIAVMMDLQVRRKNTAAFAGKQGFITLRDLFRWGERYRLAPDMGTQLYDWSQHLADEGYLVLAAKVRRPEEAQEIREVIKKHLKRDVDPDNLFTLSENTSPVTKSILEAIEKQDVSMFGHIVWTYHMRRMAVLVRKSYQFKEPVLLVGETGGGKTTICQLIAHMSEKKLYVVNCHMHTESSDFLGNLRPVRNHTDSDNQKLFEWVDGPLINAMQNGDFFLADEISLADDSVLERLNSLLEPERSLLLAEKGIDFGDGINKTNSAIIANDNFFFISTMNPGGDYGKKELSPALRNRFTEIWCDGCTKRKDLESIIVHNLTKELEDRKKILAESILDFVEWLSTSDVGKRFTVSIRDILSWVNFINICTDTNGKLKLSLSDAYYQGACLTYIDSLGSGLTSMEGIDNINLFKEKVFAFLKSRTDSLKDTSENSMEIDPEKSHQSSDEFGIPPFFIPKGSNSEDENTVSFTFKAPTTQQNTLKLLRALQLRKPLLLEGSPGVGKTSLVAALAKASGHTCFRINLSDQTDVSDLFGADLPVEGGKGGEFAWRDGPFLRALRAGHWILLDELNLASQSVLEGLNACLDHRGEVYIPELGRSFTVKPETKLFACQNPLRQGGARRGLPKSFLNRFTQVFVDALTDEDLRFIVGVQFPQIQEEIIGRMINFNSRLSKEAGVTWGFYGSPWEMNLRDVTRWCEATIASNSDENIFNPGSSVELIYINRMRTKDDKNKVKEIYQEIFPEEKYAILQSPVVDVTDENIYFGEIALSRTNNSICNNQNLLLLRDQIPTLRSLAQSIKMNWMSILVGGSGCGKTSIVHVLSQIAGQKLKSIVVNSAMDTTEILGGFEQTDYNRHLEQLVDKTENLLTHCLKTKVRKENICEIEKYQGLIERVRELSHDECESVTMAEATKLFLRKIDRLSKLLEEMKFFKDKIENELEKLIADLEQLKNYVVHDNCLNAGGKFEWIDSVLVKCLQDGTWLLVDQVNLCSPAVLDRLNGLLEPNGVLTIGERGVDNDGNVVTVKPHKNFRLFLTMDPRYGEISRAMRNRGVEIFILNSNENPESGKLDYRSLLQNSGLTIRNHQEALMTIHKRLYEDPSNVDNLNVIHLLHASFLVVQQLSRGFPVSDAFRSSCVDVYLKGRSINHRETKVRLTSIIDNTINEFEVNEADEYILDLNGATCSIRNLQYNSKLTLIRQQGILLDWCVKGYVWTADNAEDGTKISVKTDFINEFFASSSDQDRMLNAEVIDILPYVLLNFYEHSALSDILLRKMWASSVFKKHADLKYLDKKNSDLTEELLFFNFGEGDGKLPWDGKHSDHANNLALLLYYEALINDSEIESNWKISNNDTSITLAQYSESHRKGKTTIKLKNQPLITNYVAVIQLVKKHVENTLRKDNKVINNTNYAILRLNLRWFNRFCDLGKMILIKKTKGSKNTYENLDEISLLLKVHYKWLKKMLNTLNEHFEELHNQLKIDSLKRIIDEIDKGLSSVYDPFKKVCKVYKKYIPSPLPCSSDNALKTYSILQNITESFSPTKNKYIAPNLMNERKFVVYQTDEALKIRSELISLWYKMYANETFDEEVFEILKNMSQFSENRLNIARFSEDTDSDDYDAMSSKNIANITMNIQLWPIHEYMFTVYIGMFMKKLCDKLTNFNDVPLPSIHLSSHHVNIPNIPVELFAVLNTIESKQDNTKEIDQLTYLLIIWFLKYNENSYATKKFKQVSQWKNLNVENKDKHNYDETSDEVNLLNSPILVSLISELLLNKSHQSYSDNFGVVTGAALGTFGARLKQLTTLNDILWKNSVSINSEEFDQVSNDTCTFNCLLKNFIVTCENVENDIGLKKSLDSDSLKSEVKATIEIEYFEPLDYLKNISKSLTSESGSSIRGKAWTLLGYLQTFVFSSIGFIDPVHKVALKLRYVEEDITDCESTIYVAKLYSKILGFTDECAVHPRVPEVNKILQSLVSEKNSLQNLKAVRPSNNEFIALSKEFKNFRTSLSSYAIVNKHVQGLIDTTTKLKDENNVKNVESSKLAKREAEIWLESTRKFIDQVESRFLSGYPDIVLPVLAGVTQMRHGIRILTDESSRQIAIAETTFDSVKLESFVLDLVRFPTVGVKQEDLLSLVGLCTTHNTRELLSISMKSENTFASLQEQFRLTMTGLCEFHNYVTLKGSLTKDTWIQLDGLLQQIVLIWRQQQKEIEKRDAEKDSLYKNKIKVHENLTEEEEIAQELKNLFPTHRDNDFADVDSSLVPSLENNETVQNVEEDFGALITDNDIKEVQNIHSSIIRSFTSSEWLKKNSSQSQVDFIEPLLQRYNTFSLLFDNVASALSNKLTNKLYTSLNVLAQLIARRGQGESLIPDDCVKKDKKMYDYYRDSNVEEVKQCVPILENIFKKVRELLKEWPEHPTLMSIKMILQRIYSFPVTSSVSRFLTGLELLLVKMHEWEENAHSGVSLSEFSLALTQQIISWRKLELACWKDCLTTAQSRLRSHVSKWWFFLYTLFDSYVTKTDVTDDKESDTKPITSKKLIESLETFMSESTLVEYEARLELLLTFHCHSYYLDSSIERHQLLAISWNVYFYYSQFLPDINNRINSIKAPIEKNLKDFVKIARWNDISYWAVKETVEKTHRTLHKFIKEFETGLKELVTPYLIVKPVYKSEPGMWDRENTSRDSAIDPNAYIISTEITTHSDTETLSSDLIKKVDGQYLLRAKEICKETILSCVYPTLRHSLEEFVEEFSSYCNRLRALEIDRTQPRPKQKSQAKNIMHQKRVALADYFKSLSNLGISHRVGTLAWKNKLDEVMDFTIAPVEIRAALQHSVGADDIEKRTLDQWDGCERYYYGSLIKLNALNRTLLTTKTDLGMQNIEWCQGYSTHLMIIANNQKKTIASVVKYFVHLRSQISDLLNLNTNDSVITKQKELKTIVCNLKELLINARICFEQYLIYLQACPSEAQIESKDFTYSLSDTNVPIINCKKGDEVWQKANGFVKASLDTILNITKKFNTMFPELYNIFDENSTNGYQVTVMTSKHFALLTESFDHLISVKENVKQFSTLFNGTENGKHPLSENIDFVDQIITKNLTEFEKLSTSLEDKTDSSDTEKGDDKENYQNDLEKLINTVLVVLQNKYKNNVLSVSKNEKGNKNETEQDEEDDDEEDEYAVNKLREKLVESIDSDIKTLKLEQVYQTLNSLLKSTFNANSTTTINYYRLLQKCFPLLQQYLLLTEFYLSEQVASLRITCKILYKQLNVFLDLAYNGFCVPKDLDLEDNKEEAGEQSGQGGMGLGEGEGEKDVSDRIETEDQLDDAKPAGQEKEKPEDKECPEEDKGIEMSEDFEGQLQDVEQKEETKEEEDKEEEGEKQMGETGDNADKLDKQIWGDDEDEPESEETDKHEEEVGDGERTGEKEFGAKDERTTEDSEDKENGQDETEKEEKEDINEMEEPEYDEDQVNPYHGKHQPEPEPEPLDLPEDVNMEDENDKDDEKNDEENPFDIDKMKEAIVPPEVNEEVEISKVEESKDENETKKEDSSDDEMDEDKTTDKAEKEDANDNENEDDAAKQGPETGKEKQEEEEIPESEENPAKEETEEKALPSVDEGSKETDGAEQVDQAEGGSRDQVPNNANNEQDTAQEISAENYQDEKQDKGTGQSQAEQHDTGHSGSSMEKSEPTTNKDNDATQKEKRKAPGQTDEDHVLAEKLEPERKKIRTMIHAQEKTADEDNNEEGAEQDKEGEPDLCQHVKEKDKFDHYAMDAATEEQSKEQASNMEQEEESPKDKEEEPMDVDMHEDEEPEIVEDSSVKQNPEQLANEEKSKDKKDSRESGIAEDGQLENIVDVEGETTETMKVSRGAESTFFTNTIEIEDNLLSSIQVEKKRMEVEKMLSQWTYVPTTEEAVTAWNTLSAVTDAAARDLSEKLRLVLEPTQASRLKGDYRTGRRINMRKIIPYIASQFRKDKIWLRRTKPSKRDYQIVLAIDDSSSMADNHSKELAFESLSLISKAMTYLEAGQLSVISFGEQTNILHPLGETFSELSGSRLMQEMRFEQKKTMVGQLVDFTVDMFQSQNNSNDNAKLLVILSDGRGVFSEGTEKVIRAVRRARIADIFLVFIIVDNPMNKDSILDIRMPNFQDGKLIGINSYMDSFPFPFYMILRDINALPGVLSDALRQWFEVVGKIDT